MHVQKHCTWIAQTEKVFSIDFNWFCSALFVLYCRLFQITYGCLLENYCFYSICSAYCDVCGGKSLSSRLRREEAGKNLCSPYKLCKIYRWILCTHKHTRQNTWKIEYTYLKAKQPINGGEHLFERVTAAIPKPRQSSAKKLLVE